jgi:hypothetical protein
MMWVMLKHLAIKGFKSLEQIDDLELPRLAPPPHWIRRNALPRASGVNAALRFARV